MLPVSAAPGSTPGFLSGLSVAGGSRQKLPSPPWPGAISAVPPPHLWSSSPGPPAFLPLGTALPSTRFSPSSAGQRESDYSCPSRSVLGRRGRWCPPGDEGVSRTRSRRRQHLVLIHHNFRPRPARYLKSNTCSRIERPLLYKHRLPGTGCLFSPLPTFPHDSVIEVPADAAWAPTETHCKLFPVVSSSRQRSYWAVFRLNQFSFITNVTISRKETAQKRPEQ